MNSDELEEEMRKAITAGPLEPRPEVWNRVAHSISTPKKERRSRTLLIAGAAIAAGIGLLVMQSSVQPTPDTPTARTLAPDSGTGPSFFAPGTLMAQANAPVFPLVSGEGPRGLRLKPGVWKYLYIKNEVDTVASTHTYTIRRGKLNGTNTWELISENSDTSTWRGTDTLWASADSLRPLMRVTMPGGVRLEQTFRKDDVLSGYFSQSGYINWKTTPLTDTSRFNEASIVRWQDLTTVFQTSTFTPDWKRSVPMSAAAEFGAIRPMWLNLKVDGEERLATPAGTFDCWKLRLALRIDPPPGVLIFEKEPVDLPEPGVFFWVSKDKGWLIQQSHTGGRNGSTGRSVLMEVKTE